MTRLMNRRLANRRRALGFAGTIAGALLGSLLGGCGGSVWEREFKASELRQGVTNRPLATDAAVVVREVAWGPVDAVLKGASAEVAASGEGLASWSAARKSALERRLLEALEIRGDVGGYEVLGRSQFRTTETVNPADGSLEAAARRVGATHVVWSRAYAGKADKVETTPTTEADRAYYDRVNATGGRRSGTALEPVTVWQPLVVKADEYTYVAFFVAEL